MRTYRTANHPVRNIHLIEIFGKLVKHFEAFGSDTHRENSPELFDLFFVQFVPAFAVFDVKFRFPPIGVDVSDPKVAVSRGVLGKVVGDGLLKNFSDGFDGLVTLFQGPDILQPNL